MLGVLRRLFWPAARMPSQEALKIVQDKIAGNKVMVFSKTYCPYCIKAKRALSVHLKNFAVMELESDPMCDDIQDALQQLTGGRSVPRVFIDGKFIGGGDDTAAKQASGELLKLLQAAGVSTI